MWHFLSLVFVLFYSDDNKHHPFFGKMFIGFFYGCNDFFETWHVHYGRSTLHPTGNLTHTLSSDDAPQTDDTLKNTVRKKIIQSGACRSSTMSVSLPCSYSFPSFISNTIWLRGTWCDSEFIFRDVELTRGLNLHWNYNVGFSVCVFDVIFPHTWGTRIEVLGPLTVTFWDGNDLFFVLSVCTLGEWVPSFFERI